MLEAKPGSRAHATGHFNWTIARLSGLKAELVEAKQGVEGVSAELEDVRELFAKLPLKRRFWGRVLDVLRIDPIIPYELNHRYREAQDAYKQLCNLSNATAMDICLYGQNLPGRHKFNSLSYAYDTKQFKVDFTVSAKIGDEIGFFDVEAAFDTLRYKTVRDRAAFIRIPKTDSLSPVLYVPEEEIMVLITGYYGPGTRNDFCRMGSLKPISYSIPIDIKPQAIIDQRDQHFIDQP